MGGNPAAWLQDRTLDVRGAGAFGNPSGARGADVAVVGVLRRCIEPLQAATGGPVDGERDRWRLGVLGSDRLLDRPAAGRSRIIPTAVALAVDYCFQVMALHRIEIAIRPENTKSLRVVAKLGFRPEGLRPRYLHIDGDWRDHLVFALNADEVPEGLMQRWENLRQR